MDPPQLMTIDELAAYLQVVKSTLYKLAQEGKVPRQKVGKHWRFSKTAIDRWLEDPATGRPGAPRAGKSDDGGEGYPKGSHPEWIRLSRAGNGITIQVMSPRRSDGEGEQL